MSRKYWSEVDQEDGVALQPGTYEVEVTDAREVEGSSLIFMDLLVLRGPDKGSTTSVSLYCPQDGDKAVFYFKQKVRGFASTVIALAEKNLDEDEVVGALATAVVGSRWEAKLGIQTKGAYEGRQELLESRPLEGATVTSISDAKVVEAEDEAESAKAVHPSSGPSDDELPF